MNGTFMKSSLDFNKQTAKRQMRSLSYTKPRNIVKRNEDLQSTCNTFKETTKCSPDKTVYLQNYLMHNSNANYDTFYSAKKERERYAQNVISSYSKQDGGSKHEFNHYMPVHHNNMHLIRNQKYAKERVNVDMATGEVLKKQNYLENKESLSKSFYQQASPIANKRDRTHSLIGQDKCNNLIDLNRQNMYVSRMDADLKINHDIIKNRNIKHVSAASDLSPEWFKTSMSFYSKPFLQGKVHTYNGGPFQIVTQNQKSVYDNLKQPRNQGGMFNDCTRKERTNIKEIKRDTYKMNWQVADNEKSFRVTQKIGTQQNWNQNDTIKNMIYRRQATDIVSDKIGSRSPSTNNGQRPILLKIGHNSFVNTQSIA